MTTEPLMYNLKLLDKCFRKSMKMFNIFELFRQVRPFSKTLLLLSFVPLIIDVSVLTRITVYTYVNGSSQQINLLYDFIYICSLVTLILVQKVKDEIILTEAEKIFPEIVKSSISPKNMREVILLRFRSFVREENIERQYISRSVRLLKTDKVLSLPKLDSPTFLIFGTFLFPIGLAVFASMIDKNLFVFLSCATITFLLFAILPIALKSRLVISSINSKFIRYLEFSAKLDELENDEA